MVRDGGLGEAEGSRQVADARFVAVVGTEDKVIPPATQRQMAERAGATITEVKDAAGNETVVANARTVSVNDNEPPVLVLTTYDDDEVLSASLRAGAADCPRISASRH